MRPEGPRRLQLPQISPAVGRPSPQLSPTQLFYYRWQHYCGVQAGGARPEKTQYAVQQAADERVPQHRADGAGGPHQQHEAACAQEKTKKEEHTRHHAHAAHSVPCVPVHLTAYQYLPHLGGVYIYVWAEPGIRPAPEHCPICTNLHRAQSSVPRQQRRELHALFYQQLTVQERGQGAFLLHRKQQSATGENGLGHTEDKDVDDTTTSNEK